MSSIKLPIVQETEVGPLAPYLKKRKAIKLVQALKAVSVEATMPDAEDLEPNLPDTGYEPAPEVVPSEVYVNAPQVVKVGEEASFGVTLVPGDLENEMIYGLIESANAAAIKVQYQDSEQSWHDLLFEGTQAKFGYPTGYPFINDNLNFKVTGVTEGTVTWAVKICKLLDNSTVCQATGTLQVVAAAKAEPTEEAKAEPTEEVEKA